ncbi:MAG: hypothetical protein L7U25_01045, partial [Candidatus Poseidonia sp.]|nr:hypothetical protein [Poseidonia sp.]
AAMELAPSTKPIEQISDEPPLPLHEEQEREEATSAAPAAPVTPTTPAAPVAPATSSESGSEGRQENVRVRILETLDEPIIDEQGEELSLEAGDIHFLEEETAAWLVDVGVAERAEL